MCLINSYLWSWCLALHLFARILICHAEIFPFIRKTSCDLSTSILLKVTLVVESAKCVSSLQNVLGCTEKIKAPSGSRWGGALFFCKNEIKEEVQGVCEVLKWTFSDSLLWKIHIEKDLKGKSSYELTSIPTVLLYIQDWKMIILFNTVFSIIKTWLAKTDYLA